MISRHTSLFSDPGPKVSQCFETMIEQAKWDGLKVIKVKAEAGQKSVKGVRGIIKREIQPLNLWAQWVLKIEVQT